jgi:transposase InsO family protein
VSDGRVERIWKREGLKVPQKQPKRGRLWLTGIRLRPEQPNHVWAYDFVEDRTHDGHRFRMLTIVDEFAHECLAIRVSGEIFYTLREAQIIIESWRRHYNAVRPHVSLGYKPPGRRMKARSPLDLLKQMICGLVCWRTT